MAEFLVAARDLASGYRRGDPVAVQPDGQVWGRAEGLPDFTVVAIPLVSVDRGRQMLRALERPARSGEPEFTAPDPEDRVVVLHRRDVRFNPDDLTAGRRNQFNAGRVSGTINTVGSAFRRLELVDDAVVVGTLREFTEGRDSEGRPLGGRTN